MSGPGRATGPGDPRALVAAVSPVRDDAVAWPGQHSCHASRRVGVIMQFGRAVVLLGPSVLGCSLLLDFPLCEDDGDCGDGMVCVAAACDASPGPELVDVDEDIRTDTEWTADRVYVLRGEVYVQPGKTLTIRAGTTIRGTAGSALIVLRGGRIEARGRADEPVVFTSDRPEGERLAGDWGGLSLLGSARVNQPGATLEGLRDVGLAAYGGEDDAGSCGVLEYVRVEFAGYALKQDEELNGLTFAGCGSGTIVDHVQIHMAKDDGVELFGGAVDLRHVLVTRAQDDAIDWDRGWHGTGQFIAVQQDEFGDNALEADNWADDPDAEPRSAPVLYNLTLVSAAPGGAQRGVTFKEGTAGSLHNALLVGHGKEAVDVKGAATVAQANAGGLRLANSRLYGVGAGGDHFFPTLDDEKELEPGDGRDDDEGFDEDEFFRRPEHNNTFAVDPRLAAPSELTAPDLRASAAGKGIAPPPGFDEGADYIGAFDPDADPWTDGWAAYPEG